MTTSNHNQVTIAITDSSPEEKQQVLIKSLASALRWYALNPDKRHEDHAYAADLTDLIQSLTNK